MVRILAGFILTLGIIFAQPASKPCCDNNKCDDCKTEQIKCPTLGTQMHKTDAKEICPQHAVQSKNNPMPEPPGRANISEMAMKDDPMMYHDMECTQDPKEMVETIRIYKITEELNLTEDQSVKFFPKLKEMRDAREVYDATRMKIGEQLNQYLQDPGKFSENIKTLVGEMAVNDARLRDKENQIKKEIANILTPEQQAKFLLFTMHFDKQMREMVGKARDMHRDMQDMRKDNPEEQKPKRWRF